MRLVQLPTKNEFQDNVVGFWTPAEPPPLLKPLEVEYVLRWFGDAQDLPPLGRSISTRVDDQDKPYYRHFFVEFSDGPKLKPGETPTPEVASSTGAGIADVKIEWNDFNKKDQLLCQYAGKQKTERTILQAFVERRGCRTLRLRSVLPSMRHTFRWRRSATWTNGLPKRLGDPRIVVPRKFTAFLESSGRAVAPMVETTPGRSNRKDWSR